MHVGVAVSGVPNPGHGGGSLTAWSFVTALLEAGHDVMTFALGSEPDPLQDKRIRALEQLGSAVRILPTPTAVTGGRAAYARGLFWPPDEFLFPAVGQSAALGAAFAKAGIEAGLVYGTDAVAAVHHQSSPPILALMSDPPGLVRRLRLRYDPPPWSLRPGTLLGRWSQRSYALHADRRLLAMLRRFPSVGMFAAHHAARAKARGVSAWYAPSPIVDLAGPDWEARRKAASRPERPPRILMIGHLRGIATISGLQVFVDSILPALSDALGPDGFEVRIVGGYEPPAMIAPGLRHPAVVLCGQVEPPDDEFLSAAVLLVPTPIETGPRSRILSGMSFGSCVVAHEANRLGIPELAHDENTLLAPDGAGLARAVLTALQEPRLRERLGLAARRLYEAKFTPDGAGATIVRELEHVAGVAPPAQRPGS